MAKLNFEYNHSTDVMTIETIAYAGQFFRMLGGQMPLGPLFQIIAREDGTLTVKNHRNFLPANWQPIETAPRDGTKILVYRGNEPGSEKVRVGVDYWLFGQWYKSRHWPQPTHWQPLPEPPEEK